MLHELLFRQELYSALIMHSHFYFSLLSSSTSSPLTVVSPSASTRSRPAPKALFNYHFNQFLLFFASVSAEIELTSRQEMVGSWGNDSMATSESDDTSWRCLRHAEVLRLLLELLPKISSSLITNLSVCLCLLWVGERCTKTTLVSSHNFQNLHFLKSSRGTGRVEVSSF
jgi:hypothetical protein